MKRLKYTLLTILTLSGVTLSAAVSAQSTDAIEVTRAAVQTERKAIVAAAMGLSEQESQAFWPVYNDFRAEMNKVIDRHVRLIRDFAAHYNSLSDEKAKAMVAEYLSIEKAKLKLRQRYVRKFEKVLPPKKVMRYYQTENKLDALVNVQLAREIPLAK